MMAYIAPRGSIRGSGRAQGGHGYVLARVLLFSLGTSPSNLFIYFLIALLHLMSLLFISPLYVLI
jgi:hypothetical protein